MYAISTAKVNFFDGPTYIPCVVMAQKHCGLSFERLLIFGRNLPTQVGTYVGTYHK